MLQEFLHRIAERNPFQEKYLKIAMNDITPEETEKLEHQLGFYKSMGYSMSTICDKYLNLIDIIMEDQRYFVEYGKYRYSTYKESEELYKNEKYMSSYVVGLGLSTYLWHVHRNIMRFFISHCKAIKKGDIWLEIGPGHGEYFVTAMQNSSFDKYIAVDISETSVEATKQFCKYSLKDTEKNYEVLRNDFFEYSQKSKFDAVVMGEVLEHVENPLQFLKKIYDVAKNDAFIFITTAINAPQPDHIYLFNNIGEVKELFGEAKLAVVDEVMLTANNVPIEKAEKRKYAIVVGFVLKKIV